uniref:Protein brambleberry n=1 Tax=Seriola dumerili TaxID=41447 RepID=A0A3B4V9A5_SERDU
MAARVAAVLLLLGLVGSGLSSSGSGPNSERGRMELRRVQSLASQPRYGECWARALEHLDTRCKDMTSESQSRIALRFTHCHLSSSGRDFPSCPEGSEVSRCTGGMDVVAFNTYTEFFTHTHSICHFLQSEVWQSRAENAMYRLTESSAGVAEQLQSTRQITEDLIEAQSAALQAQQEILHNGEELRVTLKDSTQGLRAVFSELSSVSREQQVALSELFNRVSFLQSFLLMEAHSLSSCCYNAAALCTSFLLTSTQRSSRARLVLLGLVCLNFYLERKIYQFVMNCDHPEHRHMELISVYVSVLRRLMVCVGVCVLLCVCVQYKDPVQQSLQVLQQLRETQRGLQEVLQHADSLGQRQKKKTEEDQVQRRTERRRREEALRRRHKEEREEEEEECCSDLSHLSHTGADSILLPYTTHNASVSPVRRPRHSFSSPLVHSILVEDRQLA